MMVELPGAEFQTRVLPPSCHPIIRNSVATPGTGRDEQTEKLNQINSCRDQEVCIGMGAALYKTAALPLS
jgi:hypothetical protein